MEKYVIKNSKTNKFIDIDQPSGGYPYETEIENARIWYNKESVLDYKRVFPNEPWELHILKMESELINW